MSPMPARIGPLLVLAALSALGAANPAAAQPQTLKMGIMGDSNSDEYRADDNRGGAYADITFSWNEILDRERNIDLGPWGMRSEPRRSGYAYNWARSGARAADLRNQQTGLAQQVRDGDVEYVMIHVGVNDFNGGQYADIYNGSLSGSALQQKLDSIVSDIQSAIQAVATAGADVVITGVPDPSQEPVIQARYPNASNRQRVTDAVDRVNSALAVHAAGHPNVSFADMTALVEAFAGRTEGTNVIVGGVTFDAVTLSNEPDHMLLSDNHPGTVASGLMANTLFLEPMNAAFGTNIPLLTDDELLCIVEINVDETCSPSLPKPPVLTVK